MLVKNKRMWIAAVVVACGGMGAIGDEPVVTPPPAPPTTPAPVTAPAPAPTAQQNAVTNNVAMRDLVAKAIKAKMDGKTPSGAAAVLPEEEVKPVALSEVVKSLGGSMPGKAPAGAPAATLPAVDDMNLIDQANPVPAPKIQAGDKVFIAHPPAGGMPTTAPVVVATPVPAPAVSESLDADPEGWVKAARPSANHDLLDIFVGTWNVQATFDNGPGQPAETGTGMMVNTWQLQGRWLRQEYTGQMATMGRFSGIGYLGYDNIKQQYTATWMDTLTTTSLNSAGVFNEANSTFTLTAKVAAAAGGEFTQKQVLKVVSPDKYRVVMYLSGPDGVEFKTGELEYTRAVITYTNAEKK